MQVNHPNTVAAKPPRLTPEQMRDQGCTRRALVSGCHVTFQSLSPNCHVTASWVSKMPANYRSKDEAKKAAEIWERDGRVMDYGFTNEKGRTDATGN